MRRALEALLRVWNALSALTLQARGRWRLRHGDADGAARFLEAAAERAPGSFGSLLHLTRAHLRRRDLVLARRALARAREAHPRRFDREASAAIGAEGFDIASLSEGASPSEGAGGWLSDGAPPARTAAATGARSERGTALLESPGAPAGDLAYGDCRDLDEYTRFRSMPPISAAEIEGMDWPALLRDLG